MNLLRNEKINFTNVLVGINFLKVRVRNLFVYLLLFTLSRRTTTKSDYQSFTMKYFLLLSFSFALKFELQVGDDPRCLSIEAAAESKIDWTYVFTERDDVSGDWVLTKENGGVHVEVTPKANEYPLLSKSYSGKGKVQ